MVATPAREKIIAAIIADVGQGDGVTVRELVLTHRMAERAVRRALRRIHADGKYIVLRSLPGSAEGGRIGDGEIRYYLTLSREGRNEH